MDGSFLTTGLYVLLLLIAVCVVLRFLPQLLGRIHGHIPQIDKSLGCFVSTSAESLTIIALLVSGAFQLDANARLSATLITVGADRGANG